MAAILTV
jgi:hypothetical protein